MDRERAQRFAADLLRRYGDAMVTFLIDLGDRTGLLDAAAGGGTSAEIAARAGLAERPVREWLRGMAAAGVVEHDGAAGTFTLPQEHAAMLVGPTPYNLAPLGRAMVAIAGRADDVARSFHDGIGTPSSELDDSFIDILDRMSRYRFDALLAHTYLPAAGPVFDRLRERGGRVAELGCGSGHAAILTARALPRCEVVGYDTSPTALDRATAAAATSAVDVRFECDDASAVQRDGPFDLITAFDVIHDLPDPGGTLRVLRQALREAGALLMYDIGGPSDLTAQSEVEWAPMMYGLSVGYCLQNGLAGEGEAVGAMWGRERALAMLDEAGFGPVDVLDLPLDPINVLYVARP